MNNNICEYLLKKDNQHFISAYIDKVDKKILNVYLSRSPAQKKDFEQKYSILSDQIKLKEHHYYMAVLLLSPLTLSVHFIEDLKSLDFILKKETKLLDFKIIEIKSL